MNTKQMKEFKTALDAMESEKGIDSSKVTSSYVHTKIHLDFTISFFAIGKIMEYSISLKRFALLKIKNIERQI